MVSTRPDDGKDAQCRHLRVGCHHRRHGRADYVLPHSPRLKAIVSILPPDFLNRDSNASPRLDGLYASEGYELDARNGFYRSGLPSSIAGKAAIFGPAQWSGLDSNGYDLVSSAGGGWGEPSRDGGDYDFN